MNRVINLILPCLMLVVAAMAIPAFANGPPTADDVVLTQQANGEIEIVTNDAMALTVTEAPTIDAWGHQTAMARIDGIIHSTPTTTATDVDVGLTSILTSSNTVDLEYVAETTAWGHKTALKRHDDGQSTSDVAFAGTLVSADNIGTGGYMTDAEIVASPETNSTLANTMIDAANTPQVVPRL